MKQTITLITAAFFLLFACQHINSQPKVILHLYGGLSVPLPQLQGDVPPAPIAITFEKDYGMKLGINFGADGKYAFDKKGNIRGVLSFGYNMFINPGDYVSVAGTSSYRPTIGILTISLGGEYAFLPKERWNPFIGVDFTANFFNGSFKYDPQIAGIPDITLESATRFGIQVGAGADVTISKSIGIVAGFKYHLANLIGKDSDTSTFSVFLPTERPLNDAEYTYGGKTYDAKNISYFQIYAGISFFFGQPKKTVTK